MSSDGGRIECQLVSPIHPHDHGYGPKQDREVSDDGPALDVGFLEPDYLLEISDLVASAHLPGTSNAGFHIEPTVVVFSVQAHLSECGRPWPYERHVTAENIQQLR